MKKANSERAALVDLHLTSLKPVNKTDGGKAQRGASSDKADGVMILALVNSINKKIFYFAIWLQTNKTWSTVWDYERLCSSSPWPWLRTPLAHTGADAEGWEMSCGGQSFAAVLRKL